MEVTQDRRMDNLWATMAHPPMAHLPMAHPALPKVTMAHHVILKANMVLPNKDKHSLKIKLVQNNLIWCSLRTSVIFFTSNYFSNKFMIIQLYKKSRSYSLYF